MIAVYESGYSLLFEYNSYFVFGTFCTCCFDNIICPLCCLHWFYLNPFPLRCRSLFAIALFLIHSSDLHLPLYVIRTLFFFVYISTLPVGGNSNNFYDAKNIWLTKCIQRRAEREETEKEKDSWEKSKNDLILIFIVAYLAQFFFFLAFFSSFCAQAILLHILKDSGELGNLRCHIYFHSLSRIFDSYESWKN